MSNLISKHHQSITKIHIQHVAANKFATAEPDSRATILARVETIPPSYGLVTGENYDWHTQDHNLFSLKYIDFRRSIKYGMIKFTDTYESGVSANMIDKLSDNVVINCDDGNPYQFRWDLMQMPTVQKICKWLYQDMEYYKNQLNIANQRIEKITNSKNVCNKFTSNWETYHKITKQHVQGCIVYMCICVSVYMCICVYVYMCNIEIL